MRRKRSTVGQADVAHTKFARIHGTSGELQLEYEGQHLRMRVLSEPANWRAIGVVARLLWCLGKNEEAAAVMPWVAVCMMVPSCFASSCVRFSRSREDYQ